MNVLFNVNKLKNDMFTPNDCASVLDQCGSNAGARPTMSSVTENFLWVFLGPVIKMKNWIGKGRKYIF